MATSNNEIERSERTKLPSGYCSLVDVERHLVRMIVRDWDRLQYMPKSTHWGTAGQLIDTIATYLLEHIMFNVDVHPEGKHNQSIGLWFNGRFLDLQGDGNAVEVGASTVPKLTDLLYTDDLSEFDFAANTTSFHKERDEENLSDFGITRRNSRAFVDQSSWCVLEHPIIEISSLEAYRQRVGLRFDWEYDEICNAWSNVRPFAGSQLVFRGGHPSKIAMKATSELKRIKFKCALPRNSEWRKSEAKRWASELTSMSDAEARAFTRADLAEELTGNRDVTKPIRNLWDQIKKIAPNDIRQKMETRGPKK